MIQRIQSVYLSISVILIGLLFAIPFAEIAKDGAVLLFNFQGILLDGAVKQSGILISILMVILLVLHIYALISYKKRLLQIRVIKYSMVVLLGLLGTFAFYTAYSYNGAQISYKISTIFPLIAIILDYLAIRGIRSDEALIRSIDRIR
jgi:hypothetical protein